MSLITAFFYDRVIAGTEETCLKKWRHKLINQASGEILEIGAGTGANIQFYSNNVRRLVLSEPDRYMRMHLINKVNDLPLDHVEITNGSAEQIESEDETFDTVVTTLVCCSVTNLETSLHEIWRVLRPGGSLIFLEHVAAAEDSPTRKWQERINPVWKIFMGNCNLNRETERAILAEGFEIVQIEREEMCRAPSVVKPTIRGIARKPD